MTGLRNPQSEYFEGITRKKAEHLMRGRKAYVLVHGTEYLVQVRQSDIVELLRYQGVDAELRHDGNVVFWPWPC